MTSGSESQSEGQSPIEDPYANMDVSELRKVKEEFIEAMQFEESARIEQIIRSRAADNTNTVLATAKQNLSEQIDKAFADYDELVAQAAAERDEHIENINRELQEFMEKFEELSIKRLELVGYERELAIERERQRPVAREGELKKMAKTLAKANKVEEAIETRTEAEKVYQETKEKRTGEINERFDKKLRSVLDSIANELEHAQARADSAIAAENEKFVRIETEYRSKAVNIVRNKIRTQVSTSIKSLQNPSRRQEVDKKLKEFAEDKIFECDRQDFFPKRENVPQATLSQTKRPGKEVQIS